MCAAISRSEPVAAAAEAVPLRRWADGAAELGLAGRGGCTRLRRLYQSDPCRVLFPTAADGDPLQAVVVTTSGGIVGGDRIRLAVEADAGTAATVTTQAAEKVYRSAGATAELSVGIAVAAGAVVEWMPQETILFDRSRLRRRTCVEVASGGRLLAGEIVVFGRRAHGERFGRGLLHDAWRVRRDGRLAWADALHLDGDAGAVLARPSAFDGAVAAATVVFVSDDAAASLEAARALIAASVTDCRAAATRVGPVLVMRFLARSPSALRASYARFWANFRGATLGLPARVPRVWEV